ncbi:MAG TPA: hypothetical protein PLY40_09365, partial [Bacillota bacterium]|nr:hypothetical protein [Bacillota bacterium]
NGLWEALHMVDVLVSLAETRENLLREYVIARGGEKAAILAKILEIEAEMEEEKSRRRLIRT